MEKFKKLTALFLVLSTLVLLAGCGNGGGSAGSDTSFTMWIYSGADTSYYTDYKDNPAVQYTLSKTWGPENKTVDIEFWIPPAGREADSLQTMLASGDYPDLLDGVISDSPRNLYEDGIVQDITEYVLDYMPNYLAYLDANPEVRSNAITILDGEEVYLGIWSVNEDNPYLAYGPMYRRDWIVKYGANPQTGQAFTGGYANPDDQDSWTDDVVFPSGETEPIFISDWEWMFEIFIKAQEDLNINDTYCMSVYYPGFTWSGGICSSFGGGVPVWYADKNNEVQFGGDSPQFRAYLQCMNTWYTNGWLDKAFNERTSDIFYAIDDTSVRQGKIGMWVGLESQLGGRMDMGDTFTEGICVFGCAYPINDMYGDDTCKYIEPDCVFATSLTGSPVYVTTKAEGKDIAAICSYFDYFYTEEGALLHTLGLNAEQVAEINNELYISWGLEEGAYTIGEDGRYLLSEVIQNDGGNLKTAVKSGKIPGIELVSSVDKGYAENYENSLKAWIKFGNTALFQGTAVTNNMSNEDSKAVDDLRSKVLEFLTLKAVEMIKGNTDPYDDEDWGNWCTMLRKYNYQKAIEIYQPYVDIYSIR